MGSSYGAWSGLERSTRGLPDTALKLYDIKSRNAAAIEDRKLRTRGLDIQQQGADANTMQANTLYGPGGTAERQVGVAEGTLDLNRAKAASETPAALKPFTEGSLSVKQATLMKFAKESKIPSFQKSTAGFFNQLRERTATGQLPIDIYRAYKDPNVWNATKQPILEGLQKDLAAAVRDGDGAAIKKIEGLITITDNGKILDSVFVNAKKYEDDQTALREAEIAQKTRKPEPKLYDTTEGWQLAEGAIGKIKPTSGMEITTSDGTTIRTGVRGTPGGLQKPTAAKIEEKQIAANEGLARISNIVKSFKPEFQEIPTKLGVAWSSLKSKLGANLPPEDKARLEEFGVYKQNSLENINLYIKEITGAQMSEKEANRLRKAMPDPGDGIFGGDDPVTFKAKLINTYKKLRMTQIRTNYYLSTGIGEDTLKKLVVSGNVISYEQMEKMLDERGEEHAARLKKQNPNIGASDLFGQVRALLAQEFKVEF